jgi:hypothetical protein
MPLGELLTYEQVWELSKLWYGNRLSPDFKGRTIEEVNRIFEQLGLNGPFWRAEG